MTNIRDEKARRTRKAIIHAAKLLFELDGFDGATMRRIAKAANVGVGTLFNYFPDKHALLYEALFEELERTKLSCLQTIPDDDHGVVAQLEHVAMVFYRAYASRPRLSRVLLKEALFATDSWGVQFQQQAQEVGVHVQACIERAALRGEIDAQTDPALSTLSFFSHYYFVLLWGINQPEPPLAQQNRQINALLMQWYLGAQPHTQ